MPERLRGLDEAQMLETTTILCAKYLFDHKGPHPLTRILPPLILLRGPEVDRQPQLRLLIQLLRMEAGESANGSALVVPRLLDSLLVFLLRAWMDSQPEGVGGWFCALRDPGIRRALSLIHEQPHAEWTVDSLAAGAAQSRATFARRFAHLVGETPGAYLTRWRMCLAAKLLREGDRPLEDIAAAVGYSSAPAFSRVFQRQFGERPGRFRKATA
jgi:AraC-like DNA-binding protein